MLAIQKLNYHVAYRTVGLSSYTVCLQPRPELQPELYCDQISCSCACLFVCACNADGMQGSVASTNDA